MRKHVYDPKTGKYIVLILVVMEYTQWVAAIPAISVGISLNPCCNGIYSMSVKVHISDSLMCLNPCCNGIYSMSI